MDLAAARDVFEASVDGTVGIEEEYALCDPVTLELVPRYEELNAACLRDPVLAESVAGELISSEIEIRSGAGRDLADALELQSERRERLFALSDRMGIVLGSTGTHALSDYREQEIIDTPHYRRRAEGLKYVAWRNNTFSIHVHVGVQGADRAVRVCDRLRLVLPTLLAVSASSPYIDGRDSGLHSGRSMTFTRTFPRCGVPDAFGSWRAWADYCELLVRTSSIVEFTQLWWSVRPHHAYGTVELRICDAQPTAAENEALSALMVACVRRASEEIDAGEAPPDVPHRLIEENLWRAIRYGQDGRLLDLEGPVVEEYDAAEGAERLATWAGIDLPDLPALNGAQRQRRLIAEGATPYEVYAATAAETRASVPAIMEDT
jgi:glutamate---cysteine ligase / carboxylate-amine ligase